MVHIYAALRPTAASECSALLLVTNLSRTATALGIKLNREEAKALFDSFDPDGSGTSARVGPLVNSMPCWTHARASACMHISEGACARAKLWERHTHPSYRHTSCSCACAPPIWHVFDTMAYLFDNRDRARVCVDRCATFAQLSYVCDLRATPATAIPNRPVEYNELSKLLRARVDLRAEKKRRRAKMQGQPGMVRSSSETSTGMMTIRTLNAPLTLSPSMGFAMGSISSAYSDACLHRAQQLGGNTGGFGTSSKEPVEVAGRMPPIMAPGGCVHSTHVHVHVLMACKSSCIAVPAIPCACIS